MAAARHTSGWVQNRRTPRKFQDTLGAWWEYVVEGPLYIEQFGGAADWDGATGTDNIGPLNDAMSVVAFQPPVPGSAPNFLSGPEIHFNTGTYRFSTHIRLKSCVVILRGKNSGHDNRSAGTTFSFPVDTCGMIINDTDSLDDGPDSGGTTAIGSIVEGLALNSDGGTDTTKHGLFMRTRTTIRDCTVENFPGNGFHLLGHTENINGWYLERCIAKANDGHALYVFGSNANSGTCISFQCKSSGLCGIKEQSGLGSNVYLQPRIDDSNSLDVGRCSYDGQNYLLISDTAGVGGTTTPGTNDAVWMPTGVAGTVIPWGALNPSGLPWQVSTPIYVSGNSNVSLFLCPYIEAGHYCHFGPVAINLGGNALSTRNSANLVARVLGGTASPVFSNTGIGSYTRMPLVAGGVEGAQGTDRYVLLGGDYVGNTILEIKQDADQVLSMEWTGTDLSDIHWWYGGSTTGTLMRMWGSRTLRTAGRALPQKYVLEFPQIALGDRNLGTSTSGSANTRLMYRGSAIPTSGDFARGEIIFNTAPVSPGFIGWVCTTAGGMGPLWVTGTNYATTSFIKTTAGRFYKCTVDGGTSSTVEPTHTTVGAQVIEADGFGWTYLSATEAVWKTYGAIT